MPKKTKPPLKPPGVAVAPMKIESWPLARIKPYPRNPRKNDAAVDAVAASIRQFGFRQPIVVDKSGVIIVGHTRLKAAQKLGLTHAPVHVAADLSPAQIKALRIADNQTATLSDWADDLLPLELADLAGMDFDMSLLGFDADELKKLIDPPEPEKLTLAGEKWVVLVNCTDEADQTKFLEEMNAAGRECRALVGQRYEEKTEK
jgi:ParB-like chromosome segregation protein Spo0J